MVTEQQLELSAGFLPAADAQPDAVQTGATAAVVDGPMPERPGVEALILYACAHAAPAQSPSDMLAEDLYAATAQARRRRCRGQRLKAVARS